MAKTGQQDIAAEKAADAARAKLTDKQRAEADMRDLADRLAQYRDTARSLRQQAITANVVPTKNSLNAQAADWEKRQADAELAFATAAQSYRQKWGDPPAASDLGKLVASIIPPTKASVLGQAGLPAAPPQQTPVAGPPAPAPAPAPAVRPTAAPTSGPAPAPRTAGPPAAAGTASDPVYTQAAPPANLGSVDDQIRRNFGFMAWAIDDPEIGPLLHQAIADKWDTAMLQGALEKTNFWKTHTASQVDWLRLKATDPATAQQKIDQQLASINNTANTVGIPIDPARAKQIAEQAVSSGWSSLQLQAAIASEWHYKPGGQTGQLAQAEVQIRKLARDYLIPLNDTTLSRFEQQVAAGTATPETFRQTFINQAKGLWSSMAPQLDAGLTTRDIAAPYAQMAGRELGVDPDSIDFLDPKWMPALFASADPKTGQSGMLPLNEWLRKLRSDPNYGWDKTAAGKTAYTQMGLALTQALGLRPGG